jgi:hypothetical protein
MIIVCCHIEIRTFIQQHKTAHQLVSCCYLCFQFTFWFNFDVTVLNVTGNCMRCGSVVIIVTDYGLDD